MMKHRIILVILILLLLPIGADALSSTELAATVELNTGTLITGDLAATQAVDGTNYQVEEVTGTPGFDFVLQFITTGNNVLSLNLYGYYDGNPAHNVEGQLYDWTDETWDPIDTYPDAGADAWYNVSVYSSDYVSGGLVLLRIYHTSAGSAGHDFYLDYVEVVTALDPVDDSIFYQIFLSLEMWGYFGPLALVIIGYLLIQKNKPLGIFMIIVDSLVISHYLTLVEVTPDYWWHIFILLLGVIQCAFQMMDR